jgi:hypothetical protein
MRAAAILLTALWLGLPAAAPADEAGWRLLSQAAFEEMESDRGWMVNKYFPDTLRAAAAGFEITGYVVPVVPEPYLTSFLLVETPDACPFCGPDATPLSVIEVEMARPLPDMPEFTRLTLRGTLEFDESTMTTQMFRLTGAARVE